MKKLLTLALALVLCFALAACGGDEPSASQSANDKPAPSQSADSKPSASQSAGADAEKTEEKAPAHEHKWRAATCAAPKTCSDCGATEGNPAEHKWEDATCITPKTCSVCGAAEGNPGEHHWSAATCTAPKTCSVCKQAEGEALPHKLSSANYQSPAICQVCGVAEGTPLPAFFDQRGSTSFMEQDKKYEYLSSSSLDDTILEQNQVSVSNYRVIKSDDTHPAKDGYEWHVLTMTFNFTNKLGGRYGAGLVDYYTGQYVYDSPFTLNFNGVDYPECREDYVTVKQTVPEVALDAYVLAPVGYDGLVMTFFDPKDAMAGRVYSSLSDFEDMHPVFFRMK